MTPGSPYQQPSFGGSHGLSRQAAQANTGNSPYAQSGNQQHVHAANQAVYNTTYGNFVQGLANQYASNIATSAVEERVEPLKITAIKLGEIIGWRGWKINPAGFLRSMTANTVWAPGEVMDGNTNSRAEHNGIYAFKTAKDFLTHCENAGLEIYGKVALWGDIIEHELGYRAEFAKVISLEHFLGKSNGHYIKDLRAKYCEAA